ncbi:MAG: DUF1810 family protein [Planctomycetes bacterium]|nr:DUF1810 family protein [Planctomycetota bacterium]
MPTLQRFVDAQASGFSGWDAAMAELHSGRKRGHWIWWVLPQLEGLGTSPTSREFGVRGLDEAMAYLRHASLGPRYAATVTVLHGALAAGTRLDDLMGSPLDARKAVSSLTLFEAAARAAGGPTYDALAARIAAVLDAATAQGHARCARTRRAVARPDAS